jgi:methyl-accepting chemotaxis protein
VGERLGPAGAEDVSEVAEAANALLERLERLQTVASDAAGRTRRAAAALDERLARARETASSAAGSAHDLGVSLWEHRTTAEDTARDAQNAAEEIAAFRASAEETALGTRHLADVAQMSRDAAARIHESALGVAQAFRAASTALAELAGLSERVEALVVAVPRLARQTRLLALNAGIEAVRAEGQGGGFSAVANEVRDLALATGDTARSATELESVLRHAVDGLTRAIDSAEQEVTALTTAAAESTTALSGLPAAAGAARDLASAATRVAESQRGQWSAVEDRLSNLAEAAAGYARIVEESRHMTSEHASALEALAELVDDLQRVVGLVGSEVTLDDPVEQDPQRPEQ